jgi:putative Mg2+ transporter-C (MgtC) family protein
MALLQTFDAQLQILARAGLAMLLGAAIGLERELADKPAGLRTHMLVAGASALLIALSHVLVQYSDIGLADDLVRSDPIRIIQAVITGVSFLGAGTIIRSLSGRRVEGLTTAASLLFVAAVGASVAISQFLVAVGATVLVLVTLRGVGAIEYRLGRLKKGKEAQEE